MATEDTIEKDQVKQVTIWTDGACEPTNPGPGGYGVLLIHKDTCKELSVGYQLTTNNRMEVMGLIAGLQALREPCHVTAYTDSQYVVHLANREEGRTDAPNYDLWEQLRSLIDKQVSFKIEWKKGHSGIEENERCDELAVNACQQPNRIDTVYVANQPQR